MTFAIIGDFGTGDENAREVADLVASWDPSFIVSVGDNYYAVAGGTGSEKYDRSVRGPYERWLEGAFFPVLGNHDYIDVTPAPDSYVDYFDLPGPGLANTSGNERYYDFVQGPVHFFMLNSNEQEPDGTEATSVQAKWLEEQLTRSTSKWNVVSMHHAPHSSDEKHGSTRYMRWPYAEQGADVVVAGHGHNYERIMRNGIVYFVNGLGGAPRRGFKEVPAIGSEARYDDDWGAQKVTVSDSALTFDFYSIDGTLQDSYEILAAETSQD